MNSKNLYLIILSLILISSSCSKSTTGPSDCGFIITLQYIDKNTGEDIGTKGDVFLDSLKIYNFTKWSDGFSNIGKEVFINKTFDKGNTFFKFLSPSFDLCDDNIYLTPKGDIYIIKYSNLTHPDSILFEINNDNGINTISYSFNDSLIAKILRNDFESTKINLPTIQILK